MIARVAALAAFVLSGPVIGGDVASAETRYDAAWCDEGRFVIRPEAVTADEVAVLLPDVGDPVPGAWLMRFEQPNGRPASERYYAWLGAWTVERAKTYCSTRHHMLTKPLDGTYAFTVSDTTIQGCDGREMPDVTSLTKRRRLEWPGFFAIAPIVASVPIPLAQKRISEWVWQATGQPPGLPDDTVRIGYEARATGRESFDVTARVDLKIADAWCVATAEMTARRVSP